MSTILSITPTQLHERLANPDLLVIDVREPWEYELCRLENSLLIPLGTLQSELDALPKLKDIVLVCHHGIRSLRAAYILQNAGFDKLYNLTGGVDAWAQEVDLAMARY